MTLQVQTYQRDYEGLIEVLWIAIGVLVVAALFFLVLTLLKRFQKISDNRKKILFQKTIDDALFAVLFNEAPIEESAIQLKDPMSRSSLFQKIAIKSIVALHHNYTGAYKKTLEDFYVKSDLYRYSLKKLDAHAWPKIVEGIRDLSNLNYSPAFNKIATFTKHQNQFIQTEALIGIIRLRGLGELIQRKENKLYLNDWVQSNILFAIQSNHIKLPENIDALLNSSNDSMVLLGARLIDHFQQTKNIPAIEKAMEKYPNGRIREELGEILQRLKTYTNTTL